MGNVITARPMTEARLARLTEEVDEGEMISIDEQHPFPPTRYGGS